MSRIVRCVASTLLLAIATDVACAQSSITPLATFGANGWLAPGTSSYLGSAHLERGLALNPVTGNLVLVSRNGGSFVRVLHGATGIDLGGLDTTGITGGTFAVDMAGVADDGSIYVCNLSTSLASPFKVYKWASEPTGFTTPPTVAYNAASGVTRTGDSFAVYGGVFSPAKFAAAGSNNVSASNFVVGPLDGSNTSTAYLSVPGTLTTSNDYRLGMTFVDEFTLIGNQGTNGRYTALNGAAASVTATIPFSAAQRPLDYAVVNGVPVLAVIDTNSSLVSVYDVTAPATPVLLVAGTAVSGTLTANTNATGSVQWGAINGNTALLYAMSTNQGIQAFTVVIDPPAGTRQYGAGCGTPVLTLSAVGAPILPSTIQLQVDNLDPLVVAGFHVFGFGDIPGGALLPFGPNCYQHVIPLTTSFFFPGGVPSFQQPQTFPADPAYAGLLIFVQAGSFDVNSNILTTNGLRMRLNTF